MLSEEYLWKIRTLYKQSLPSSWQKVSEQDEFFLGYKEGKSWRWGRKGGQYYYDIDTIPNRQPTCYRDRLPSKEALIAEVDANNLRGSRERQAEQVRSIREQVSLLIDNNDINTFMEYEVGDLHVIDLTKARQLAASVAWCKFIKQTLSLGQHKELGFPTQADFLACCAELLAAERLEGLKVSTPGSLRNKIAAAPADERALRSFLINGRYCNDNRRVIGKFRIVDPTTGEIMTMDEHEVAIMTLWLNPGGSTKDTKVSLYDTYSSIMESVGKFPVKYSTFTHYINKWNHQVLSSKERHGTKHSRDKFRPYVPAKPLEYANSLWASDGSGVVPYRYQDHHGKWRMMKLYVMMISDVASRYIAGYSYSHVGSHKEDFTMMRGAMRSALLGNGKTEVLDFISDNHGAYTSEEAKGYLQTAVRKFRTISPGNSQANPAEMMFRLFKRRFKTYFNLPETSWNARGLESMANPDYYDIMTLPTYDEAIVKLATAVEEWNNTKLSNGITPAEWFHTLKNPKAEQYSDRQFRMITGEVSRKDLSYSRSFISVERKGEEFSFSIPSDAETVGLIARHMGYASKFDVRVIWNAEGADIYTKEGVYMFTCPPTRRASKSESEADHDSLAALGYNRSKGEQFDAMLEGYSTDLENATSVLCRNYDFNVRDEATKEEYNRMREEVSAAEYNRELAKQQAKEKRAADRQKAKEQKATAEASLQFKKSKITDLSKYTK